MEYFRKIIISMVACFFMYVFAVAGVTNASANNYYLYNNGQAENFSGPISVYMMGSGGSDYSTEFTKYNTYIIDSSGHDSVKEISLNKGSLKITVFGKDMGKGVFELYSRADCSANAFMTSLSLNAYSTMTTTGAYRADGVVSVPASGIYYLRFRGEEGKEYQLSVCQYDAANRVLEEDIPLLSYTNADLEPTYYQVNMLKNGYFTVTPSFYVNGIAVDPKSTTDSQYLDMCLVDESLKELTTDELIGVGNNVFDGKQVYAVDKGTYYLRVYSDAPRVYTLNMTQSSWKLQGGKKKKRKKLVSGKWYKSYLDYPMTTSTGDYYYFKLKKKTTVKLMLSGSCGSGLIKGTITGADVAGKYDKVTLRTLNSSKTWNVHTKKFSKLPAGKYYLRIAKDTKTTNGYYKVKIKIG